MKDTGKEPNRYSLGDYLFLTFLFGPLLLMVGAYVYEYLIYDRIDIPVNCFGVITAHGKGDMKTERDCRYIVTPKSLALEHEVVQCTSDLARPTILNPNQVAAFTSLAYTVGIEAICTKGDYSSIAKLLAMEEVQMACKQIVRWNHAKIAGVDVVPPWLTERRIKEQTLCLTQWEPKW